MTHPARILSTLTLSFLIGVFIGSWMLVPSFAIAMLAIVGCVAFAFQPRRIIIPLFLIGLALGVYAMAAYPPPVQYSSNHEQSGAVYQTIYAVRDWFLHGLKVVIPEPHAAFIAGILVGAKSELPKSIIKDFQQTGTSHIIAVSGYNITIVAGALMKLLLVIFSRRRAFWLTVAGLIAFMILTGAQASVVRATIMGVTVLLAHHVGRLPSPLHALMLAAGIMVALNPPILRYDIGFQLSFLATFGILVVAPILERYMLWTKRLHTWGEVFVLTIAANICVLPLILYYFKSLPVYFIPVNIIVLPVIPATMLVGFFAGVLHVVPLLGEFAGYLAGGMSSIILAVIHFFAHIPGASLAISINAGTAGIMYLLLGMLFLRYRRHGNEQDI